MENRAELIMPRDVRRRRDVQPAGNTRHGRSDSYGILAHAALEAGEHRRGGGGSLQIRQCPR